MTNIVNVPSQDVTLGVRIQVTNGRNQIQRTAGSYNALYLGPQSRIYEFYIELQAGESYTSNPGESISNLVVSTSGPLRLGASSLTGPLILDVRKALVLDHSVTSFKLTNTGTSAARVYLNVMTVGTVQSEAFLFWGAAAIPVAYDETFIRSLSDSGSGDKNRIFTVDAGPGQYIYYCYPTALGASEFEVNQFVGGINLVATAMVTLDSGPTNFNIYESENPNLGLTAVKVIPA